MNALDTALYHLRRSRWLVDPTRWGRRYRGVAIRRPIFMVGNQGGGLTLVGRMLRRNAALVSISGDHTYWSGADEMQRVMELRLPRSLKLARLPIAVEAQHDVLTAPRSWSYATDALIDQYRKTERDLVPAEQERFRRLIREAVHHHGRGRDVRFFDKSQVFTVKMPLVQAMLADADPSFVLVTRDPYVACYRAATGKAIDMARYAATMPLEARVQLCAEHWDNAMRIALDDGERLPRFHVTQFERFLDDPEAGLRALCSFLDLEFDADMLPQPHHVVPRGSRFRDRWYPLRRGVNRDYLSEMPAGVLDIIHARCGETARRLGYDRP